MLDVTYDDVAALGDGDLRDLVARLCEATMRSAGQSSAAVTSGGHQDAADGGLDVRVEASDGWKAGGYVPKAATGFQVKKSDMPPAAITKEMRPRGRLRQAIGDLAARGGGYVIASSGASVSDAMLAKRRAAMRTAVADHPDARRLKLDFYDAKRLASWVGEHPGLVPWVRAKAGRQLRGWQSHGDWASSPEGERGEYLAGEEVRVHGASDGNQLGLSALAGMEAVRDVLRGPGRAVRLVGLSGMGKTRFAQALFDARGGADALDPALALYANMGDEPDPPPVAIMASLIARRTRAVLVVDNCGADLHRRLAELALAADGTVSVLTVEYDVADDQPEGTEVFRLEPASPEVIGRLLARRFPGMSKVNVGVICDNAGGNARIAIALAQTVGTGENLAGLSDRDLFRRLFEQRNAPDPALLAAAEACSLVYSFDVDTAEGAEAELPRLAALAGLSRQQAFRQIGKLKARDLVQSRGRWRAVLPQAIANRLAEGALDTIAPGDIEEQLVRAAPGRLARSFSRRLGHLHRSAAAVRIARSWLAPSGLLADVSNLNGLGQAMFANIAPLAPADVLSALERAAEGPGGEALRAGPSPRMDHLPSLLRSIAYDGDFFERCCALLVRAALAEDEDANVNSVATLFASLFPPCLSGTHATAAQRAHVVTGLLRSGEERRRRLGLQALGAALEAAHFSSVHGFAFGSRVRDYGYEPRDRVGVLKWYGTFIGLARILGCSDLPVAPGVRSLLARHFQGLWLSARMHDALEDAARAFGGVGRWREGWTAIRQTLYVGRNGTEVHERERLKTLEAMLAPRDLADRVRAAVMVRDLLNLGETEDDGEDPTPAALERSVRRSWERAEVLGREVARDGAILRELLPELLRHHGDATPAWHFGRGLGQAANVGQATWHALAAALRHVPAADASLVVPRGYLEGLHDRDPEAANALLDAAVEPEGLAAWFPSLQSALMLDRAGLARLHRSLTLGIAPARSYLGLQYCGLASDVAEADVAGLLEAVAAKPGGVGVALEVAAERLHAGSRQGTPDVTLVATARRLLESLSEGDLPRRPGYMMIGLVKACTAGPEGERAAMRLCGLVGGVSGLVAFNHNVHALAEALLVTQPHVALTAFTRGGQPGRKGFDWTMLDEFGRSSGNPLDSVAPDVIIAWCDQDPTTNYPLAAACVRFEGVAADDATKQSWTAVAVAVIERAPDRLAVLRTFVARFSPRTWSGSRAAIVSRRAGLLARFEQDGDPEVAASMREARELLEREAEQDLGWERMRSVERDERFE